MQAKSFQFNFNKCVGCHACVVACTIENQTLPETIWRDISSFNPLGYPDIPLFHFSLACNHCEKAPCLKNCPALAYSKDETTGAILHFANKCIGCKYCTWACPYDAPKYNIKKGIIEKCTFCNHRIEDCKKPACANLCPTGALDFINKPKEIDHADIHGFTDADVKPSIKFIGAKRKKQITKRVNHSVFSFRKRKSVEESKITFKKEWTLAIFTLLASILISVFTASIFSGFKIEPYSFLSLGLFSVLLSLMHLGRKFRAWRAIFNLKDSWLSREILFYGIFWMFSAVYLLYLPFSIFAWLAVVFGVLALLSVDKVYKLAIQPTPIEMHSAHVLLSFFLFSALFFENYYALTFVIAIKSGLYIYRKLYLRKQKKAYRLMASAWRLDMIISFPLLFWLFEVTNVFWWLFASILIGEIIDRGEYYEELDIITPKKQIEQDFKN